VPKSYRPTAGKSTRLGGANCKCSSSVVVIILACRFRVKQMNRRLPPNWKYPSDDQLGDGMKFIWKKVFTHQWSIVLALL
jgi:hypothetical protein